MALQTGDLFIVERGGVDYQMDATDLKAFLQANYIAADEAARDALTLDVGDEVYVVDATDDATVDAGGAKYIWDGAAFLKIAEDESFDLTIAATNLLYIAGPTSGTVTNTSGTDAIIPAVDATSAGLATPAMLANSHVPATSAATSTTNPVTVNPTQVVGFSIAALAALP